jgi:protein-S-isoprenylcysteine O-methyltransferase Ste14
MKARSKKDYSNNWVQTVSSVIALLFVVLGSLGVLTPEQTTAASPLIATTLGAVSTAIAGIVALIGIFFKPSV